METKLIELLSDKLNQSGKDLAYFERDILVCLFSKIYPSYLMKHPDSDKEWENDWRNIVVIKSPTGQLSWHIHDSELPFFSHLEYDNIPWDGHTTIQKYIRIGNIQKNNIEFIPTDLDIHLKGNDTPKIDISGIIHDNHEKLQTSDIIDIVKKIQLGRAKIRIHITRED